VARRALRWQPRSYLQVWALAASGYLACTIGFLVFPDWPRDGRIAWVMAALTQLGIGISQSCYLHRRRTG
jgi:hypothetical protein